MGVSVGPDRNDRLSFWPLAKTFTVGPGGQFIGFSAFFDAGDYAPFNDYGDVVLYRSTSPYTLVDGDGYRQHQLRMPLHGLALPDTVVRRVTATRLRPGHPVSDLACTYFQRLAARQQELTPSEAESVGRPGLELIREEPPRG